MVWLNFDHCYLDEIRKFSPNFLGKQKMKCKKKNDDYTKIKPFQQMFAVVFIRNFLFRNLIRKLIRKLTFKNIEIKQKISN